MNFLNDNKISNVIEYRKELTKLAFRSGYHHASIWVNEASFEQIKELITKSFTKYVKNNDITFLYRGVEMEIRNAIGSHMNEVMEKIITNTSDPSLYIIFDLIGKYHEGLCDGVEHELDELRDLYIDRINNDYVNDDGNDNDDNDDDNDNNDDDC